MPERPSALRRLPGLTQQNAPTNPADRKGERTQDDRHEQWDWPRSPNLGENISGTYASEGPPQEGARDPTPRHSGQPPPRWRPLYRRLRFQQARGERGRAAPAVMVEAR